jgi:hypothetical protein
MPILLSCKNGRIHTMDFSYYCEKKRHVMDTIMRKPSSMIPIALLHIMQHSVIERIQSPRSKMSTSKM